MRVACAFRHERIQEAELVEIDAGGASARICPQCLILITIHRRIHHMRLEKIIPEMAA
jgi:hypothetical protein